jgi:hypothetical protein
MDSEIQASCNLLEEKQRVSGNKSGVAPATQLLRRSSTECNTGRPDVKVMRISALSLFSDAWRSAAVPHGLIRQPTAFILF